MDSKYTSKDAISVHLVNHGTGEDEKWMGCAPAGPPGLLGSRLTGGGGRTPRPPLGAF